MLFITAVVGVVVWAISDSYQTKNLERLFNDNLSNRLSHQAEEQRNLFDRYVKGHHQSVKLFTLTHSLIDYAENNLWKKYKKIRFYKKPPPWLPRLSVIRNFIQPRYLLLLDTSKKVREVYQPQDLMLPDELINPSQMLLNLSNNQGFLTTFDDKLYLVASSNVLSASGHKIATLILAAPLDEQFLVASQGTSFSENNVIALLNEDSSVILVSSDSSLIMPGAGINSMQDSYRTIGQGFFDYGATDIAIVLASFISTEEVEQLTGAVLKKDRQQRAITAVAYILAFVIIIFLVTRRIQNLTNHVVEFSRKMKIDTPEERRGDQISILEETFNRMANAVKNETEALEHQALHDPLTELPNRKLLNNRLQQEILRGERSSKPLVIIMSDLNHFKEVNDTLGHHIGDMVLQQAGLRLFKVFRRTDTVARLGGDEFGILLPETTIDQATLLTRKVVEAFSQPFIVEGHKLSVGISLGLAEFPTHGNDVNILVQRADVAMYQAKHNNLGYAFYNPDKDTHSIGRLEL
jgi:diguanylate cyclase (GGDEF)-like protein